MSSSDLPKIDAARLWSTIQETARFGSTQLGGVCRLALSDDDRRVRDWLVEACRAEGCQVRVDTLGNIFARRAGRRAELPAIAIGSHLDTQPTGGRFDGILGVLAGLEVVRTLNQHGVETEHPIEVIDWTNEEGARFSPAMLGSGVFAGVLEEEYVLSRCDRDGRELRGELERIGYRGDRPCGAERPGSYFELHIEQGPVLESGGQVIGIVLGAQGMRWYDLVLEGQAAHAGTTPLDMRRDASLGAARVIHAVNALARETGAGALATTGVIESEPGSRNVVPSRVFLTVDLRNPDDAVLDRMEQRLEALVSEIAAECRLESRLSRMWESAAVRFDPGCVEAVRRAAERGGHSAREIVSGAGHDAVYVSRVVPTAMIFIPCRDGISHNEIESAEPQHVEAGASVLLAAVLERDRAAR